MTRRIPDERCREVLDYYFGEASQPDCTLEALVARTKMWFFRNAEVDETIRRRFLEDVEKAARGEYDAWRETALGTLALVVLLDQLPRNIHRGSPRAFEHDAKSFAIASAAIEQRVDEQLTAGERLVFYLPLMHAEDRAVQEKASQLYAKLATDCPAALRPELENASKFANRHREIVDRFGRFPHRNAVLGRSSTDEEIAFLAGPNSSF